jgi:hypothetical protein
MIPAVAFVLVALAFDFAARTDCAIWSSEPGGEVCESCGNVALEEITLVDGSVVREAACQGGVP